MKYYNLKVRWFDNSISVYRKLLNLLHCLKSKIISIELRDNKIVIQIEKLSEEFSEVDKDGWINYKTK